jgi:hypothetical protein
MHGAFGQFILAVILVGGTAMILLGQVGRIRQAGGRSVAPRAAGKRGQQAMTALAHPGPRHLRAAAKAEAHKIWETARSTDWLEERRHGRANGNGQAPAAAPQKKRVLAGVVKKLAPSGSHGPGGGAQPGAAPTQTTPAPNGNGRAPSPPPAARPASSASPRTSPSSASPGGNGTVAGNGHVEQLIEGYNGIYAEAMAGNIHAKQRGIKSAGEGSARGSQMASMLSRSMSEPGSNYGPEITEPLAKAAQHEQAAAMAYAEADAALASLMQMSVGELATSARQAPHHTELTENGSH